MNKAVVLMNLGSPDSTTVKDLRKYLSEFLMDERVIDLPYLNRLLLVKGIIVPFRAPKSARAYRAIWTDKGSPLIVLTKQLQSELQKKLTEPVEIAMRYGNPCPESALNKLWKENIDLEEVIVLPLYPHYAMSSYETAVEHMRKAHRDRNYTFKLTFIKPYFNQPDYILALAESIRPYLQQDFDHFIFSYHGVPERHIYKADITGQHCLKIENCCEKNSPAHRTCYRHQCIVTTGLVAEKLGIPKETYSLSFQSRLGRSEWLKPYTAVRLQELPKQGIRKLLIACPAFVSDCLETLEEIAKEGKELFMHAGGESFNMIPCLNVHPKWVEAIIKWIREYNAGNKEMILL